MILALSTIPLFLVCLAFISGGRTGILAAIVAMPFIAAGWSEVLFGPVSPPRIAGVLFPLLVFARMAIDGKVMRGKPFFGFWVVMIGFIGVAALQDVFRHGILNYIQLTVRPIHGMMGFFMIPAYFSKRDDFRKLLIAFLLAGAFPIATILYQLATGTFFTKVSIATADLVRLHGFYHGMQTQRIFVLQVVAAALLLWAYFLRPRNAAAPKVLLLGYVLVGLFTLYFAYSKAAVIIIGAWLLIWTVGQRSLVPVLMILALAVTANTVFENRLMDETEVLFRKEIGASDADAMSQEETDQLLQGRVGVWREFLGFFGTLPLLQQIFGYGSPNAAHNDFMANLLIGGFVGLLLYCGLLFANGVTIARNFMRRRNPLNVMAVMVFAMWLVDSIGLVPSQYSFYQWFVWGLIGLSYKGVEGLSATPRRPTQRNAAFRSFVPARPANPGQP